MGAGFGKIENNFVDVSTFQKKIEEYTISRTQKLLGVAAVSEKLPVLIYPKCKSQQLLIKDIIVKCPDESCGWVQFRNICGVHLSITDIENLVVNGKTFLIKGIKVNQVRNSTPILYLMRNLNLHLNLRKIFPNKIITIILYNIKNRGNYDIY